MQNFVIILIVAAILTLAGWYVYRAKKRGQTCIGCPHSKHCSAKVNGSCSCGK